MNKLFCLICFICISFNIFAKDVYCTIVRNKDNTYQIIPNEEYLNDGYWNFITKDNKGNIKKFNTLQDAINQLSRFDWYVIRGQEDNDELIIMGHPIETFFEIKSSREELNRLFEE